MTSFSIIQSMANFNVSLNLGGLGNAGSASQNVQTGDTITLTIGNTVSGTYNRAVIAGAITPGNQTGATQNPNVLTAGSAGSYNILFTSGVFGFGGSNTFVTGSLTGTISAASNTPSYSVTAPSTISEGSSGTISVSTTNVSNGTILYWALAPSSAVATSTGTVSISSNSASFTASPNSGDGTEPAQTIAARLYTDSARTNQVASDSFVIPANTESGGGGGGGTGGGGSTGTTTHGIEVFSRDGDLIFGTDIRTQNVHFEGNITISGNSTSSETAMTDANVSTKSIITILGYYRSGGPFTINTSATGFTITNNNSGQETANVLAFRIG